MTANDMFLKLQEFATVKFRVYFVKKANKKKKALLKRNGVTIRKLTSEEKKAVDKLYKGIGKYDYETHELYKTVIGKFEPTVIPEMLFRTKIEIVLNKGDFKYAWDDKTYIDLFFPEMKMPKLILRNISGCFYDKSFNSLTKNEAINIIKKYNRVVFKKSYDSGCGTGVKLVNTNKDNLDLVIDEYKRDYIIQEVFKQHHTMANFNESSVNVIRYNSLLLDGQVIPLDASLRIGAKGNFTDHSEDESANDSCIIGIDKNGRLKDKAYHTNGILANEDMQVKDFKGIEIPGFDEMTQIILDTHKKLGYFGYIGWDFVVDEYGHAVVMEYNLNGAGILFYQYTNGPLFAEYTNKVLESIKNK